MSDPKPLKRGDSCPQCHGRFVLAPVPTDEQYRKAFDRENPGTLPPGYDTASPDQRAELGELHVCSGCGYWTRFAADEPARA